jgi:hypothetical protein
MSNTDSSILYIPGSLRFKSNTNKSLFVQVPLQNDFREFIEGDRSSLINLEQLFEAERQGSSRFRVAGKITNIFDNTITGKTNYTPFTNSLYYVDAVNSVDTGIWKGYPQSSEFSFFRTEGISGHTTFIPKSAGTYNYNVYLSYNYSSSTTQVMSYRDSDLGVSVDNFISGDGIPFVIQNNQFDGKPYIYFYCATPHNLQIGQYVELSVTSNNTNLFQVYDLGDENFGSAETVFALYDIGYTALTNNIGGTFKRIVDIQNSGETKSKYYVRLHKILTTPSQSDVTKMGFENSIFASQKKLEYSALTPNNIERISQKNDTQSFSFSFDEDIDISGLLDSNKKPIKELFLTVIEKGFMGWFNKPYNSTYSSAIDIGWSFNFEKDMVSNWWNHSSYDNKDDIPVSSYTINGRTFFYNQDLPVGHVIKGDFCEYNETEQQEYVLSKMSHKFSYNPDVFQNNDTPEFPSGYVYQTHYSIPIRQYSTYIESAEPQEVDNLPDWAYYSQYYDAWYWRDIYTYGFTDADGFGVDLPFINGSHYPFAQVLFLQTSVIKDTSLYGSNTQLIIQPIIDECE